ncbi:MAG: hypothetical protein ACK456_08930 [Pseudanabaenaceae cyanobacterium]
MNTSEPQPENASLDAMLYPKVPYRGEVSLPNIIFDANLQEFAQRITLICALESGGKISQGEAYQQIKELWINLHESKKNLFDNPPQPKIEPDNLS